MTNPIEQPHFSTPFFLLLEETFEKHYGIFLDSNTSLFQTLEAISAQQASIPVGGKCATLAAQVAHVTFYLEVSERALANNDRSTADWGKIWRTVGQVSPAEWDDLRNNLKQVYARIMKMFRSTADWDEDSIGYAMAMVVHSAYHLGEIRQALCFLT